MNARQFAVKALVANAAAYRRQFQRDAPDPDEQYAAEKMIIFVACAMTITPRLAPGSAGCGLIMCSQTAGERLRANSKAHVMRGLGPRQAMRREAFKPLTYCCSSTFSIAGGSPIPQSRAGVSAFATSREGAQVFKLPALPPEHDRRASMHERLLSAYRAEGLVNRVQPASIDRKLVTIQKFVALTGRYVWEWTPTLIAYWAAQESQRSIAESTRWKRLGVLRDFSCFTADPAYNFAGDIRKEFGVEARQCFSLCMTIRAISAERTWNV